MMKINLKKTNIMVFQNRARKCAELRFLIDGQIIDIVQECTYLGTLIPHKTNIMVFQNRARKCAELRFLIDGQIIDIVQECTYLGTLISS